MEKEIKTSPQALCSLLCLGDESESGEKILYCQERTGTTLNFWGGRGNHWLTSLAQRVVAPFIQFPWSLGGEKPRATATE